MRKIRTLFKNLTDGKALSNKELEELSKVLQNVVDNCLELGTPFHLAFHYANSELMRIKDIQHFRKENSHVKYYKEDK